MSAPEVQRIAETESLGWAYEHNCCADWCPRCACHMGAHDVHLDEFEPLENDGEASA